MTDGETAQRLRVACIVGGGRQADCTTGVAGWLADFAAERDDVALSVVDLADYDLPAEYPVEPTADSCAFTGALARAEGFVVVTPECNRSFPGALKQAIDLGYDEWHAKPVGFVSYGFGSDGLYAVEQLRGVFTELHAVTVRDAVGIDLRYADEKGLPGGSIYAEGLSRTAAALLDQLIWWGLALRDARAARPYVA